MRRQSPPDAELHVRYAAPASAVDDMIDAKGNCRQRKRRAGVKIQSNRPKRIHSNVHDAGGATVTVGVRCIQATLTLEQYAVTIQTSKDTHDMSVPDEARRDWGHGRDNQSMIGRTVRSETDPAIRGMFIGEDLYGNVKINMIGARMEIPAYDGVLDVHDELPCDKHSEHKQVSYINASNGATENNVDEPPDVDLPPYADPDNNHTGINWRYSMVQVSDTQVDIMQLLMADTLMQLHNSTFPVRQKLVTGVKAIGQGTIKASVSTIKE